MADISIEIKKTVGIDAVSLYVSFPSFISPDEARGFCDMFAALINIAEEWGESSNVFERVKNEA